MNSSIAASRLRWKEGRQLLPLSGMLVCFGLAMHFLILLPQALFQSVPATSHALTLSLLIGLPGLFAVGAGALLVGQEKDQRTLQWLGTLPVLPAQLIRTKLLMGLAGLIAMWVISGTLSYFFSWTNPGAQVVTADGLISWPLHSLFLLLAGFALAWQCKSSFHALLWLVPAAIIPGAIAIPLSAVLGLLPEGQIDLYPNNNVLLGCQAVACAAALWWCWSSGHASLGAAPAPRFKTVSESHRFATESLGRPMGSRSALVWQMARQNTFVLAGCASLLAIAIGISIWAEGGSHASVAPLFAVLFGLLGMSWLGVTVFQGDQIQDRKRFLAERGISPKYVWLTRHAAPVAIATVAVAVGITCIVLTSDMSTESAILGIPVAIVALIIAALVVYLTSQWVSLMLNSPVVAAIIAPAASFGVLVMVFTGQANLGAPIWLLTLCILALPVATLLLSRKWMDGTRDRTYWAAHGCVAGALLIVPAIPLGITYATLAAPENRELAAKLNAAASIAQPVVGNTVTLGLDERQLPQTVRTLTGDQRNVAELDYQIGSGEPITLQGRSGSYLQGEIELARLHLDADSARYREHYRACLDLALRAVQGLRKVTLLNHQEEADRFEIRLLRHMLMDDAVEQMGKSIYSRIGAQISDRPSRMAARKQAIISSLKKFYQDQEYGANSFGQISLKRNADGNIRNQIRFSRDVENMVQVLWRLAEAGDSDSSKFRQQLAEFWRASPAHYGLGTLGKYYRADDPNDFLQSDYFFSVPGQHWNAGWERMAQEYQPQPARDDEETDTGGDANP